MEKMALVVKRWKRKYLIAMENSPSDQVLWPIIKHFLYAPREDADSEMDVLKAAIDLVSCMDTAIGQYNTTEKWVQLLDECFLNETTNQCHVIGKPSKLMAKNMADAEDERVKQQKKTLGEEKLTELAQILERAVEANEVPPSDALLDSFIVPDATNIPAVKVVTCCDDLDRTILKCENDELSKHLQQSRDTALIDKELDVSMAGKVPIMWIHVNSVFCKLKVICDTTSLPPQLRQCLPLLFDVMFKLPVKNKDGSIMDSKSVIESLQGDTISTSFDTCSVSPALCVEFIISSEASEIDSIVKWMNNIMYNTILDPKELKKAAQKMLKEFPEYKRSPRHMSSALMDELLYNGDTKNVVQQHTNKPSSIFTRQQTYLEKLVSLLDEENENAIADMEACRQVITSSHNLRLVVITNLLQISNPYQAFGSVIQISDLPLKKGLPSEELRLFNYISYPQKSLVLGLSGAENSTLQMSCPGIGANHEDLPALTVAIEFLTALEGDFWVKIRGLGLSYGYSMYNSTKSKRLTFSLSRSADPIAARAAAITIVEGYNAGTTTISDTDLESTKSTCLFNVLSLADTKSQAASLETNHFFDGLDSDYERNFMSKLLAVTKDDVLKALKTYLNPLFTNQNTSVVVTPMNKVTEVSKSLKGVVEIVPEDALADVFPPICTSLTSNEKSKNLPTTKRDIKTDFAGSLGFTWANKQVCECPRCDRPAPAV
mmetsp:Transcript_50517/g.58988  ORF Transcript_50517/g.58988 Transcript_50517/m.58988 type:complete len:717 (-) Transcript_50517:350-2500(-)